MRLILTLVFILVLSGCEREGPAERAGERGDEIIENIKDGDAPLKERGPLEKTGDAIDDAVEDTEY